MSLIRLQTNSGGTGTLTIAAPNTNTDRTLTLPNSTGTIATDVTTLDQFNVTGSAPVYACRAWVNFNGTGTVAIRGSENVTSITDNGTGNYTVNFTTAMPNATYSTVLGGKPADSATAETGYKHSASQSTTSVRLLTVGGGGSLNDAAIVTAAIFG